MGIADFGLPRALVEYLAAEYKLESFFETGTYYGESSAWAAQRFSAVTTVERSPIQHVKARLSLAHLPNVVVLLGDSRALLAQTLASLPPTLFWLDAHWCGGETAGQFDAECPLLDELNLLAPLLDRHFVLIDDARLFAMPPPLPHRAEAWPCLAEIFDVLRSRHQPYITICRDVIVAVPANAKPGLVAYLQRSLPETGTVATGP
jgi:hypothetical protein